MHTKGYTLRLSLSELLLISIREEFTLEVESLKVGKAKKGGKGEKDGKRWRRRLLFCNQPFGKRSVIM